MLSNVTPIATGTYRDVLKFSIRTGGNLLVLGMAGTGKTEMAQQACVETGFEAIYMNLSVLEYPDLVGLQTISFDEKLGRKFVEYASPKFLPLAPVNPGPNHKKKVIILDELDKAKDELQNPLLEMLQFHTINGSPIDVQSFILTGNLPDEGAFSRPISHALTNRCMVYKVEHEFDSWLSWAVANNLNPLVVGFLSRNRDQLSVPAVDGDPTAYCRPSPRSWAMAARDLDASQVGGRSSEEFVDFQTVLVAGRVGTPAALKFKVWLDHYRHIEPALEELTKHGNHPTDLSFDRSIVCAIAASAAVASACRKDVKASEKAKQVEYVNKLTTNVFGWLSRLPPDQQICAVKSTLNNEHVTQYGLVTNQLFMKVFTNLKQALR